MSNEHYKLAVLFKQATDEWKDTAAQLIAELNNPNRQSLEKVVVLFKAAWADNDWVMKIIRGEAHFGAEKKAP